MRTFTLYVTRYCGYCRIAERLLISRKLPYEVRDLTDDDDTRKRIVAQTGWHTLPIIFLGDRLIGGLNELSAMMQTGKLDSLLAEQEAGTTR